MSEDEQGKRFLELIDQQNNIQWKIIAKLTTLIQSKWDSIKLKTEIEFLVATHSIITKELNNLDGNNRFL
jgi:hypothetical protein